MYAINVNNFYSFLFMEIVNYILLDDVIIVIVKTTKWFNIRKYNFLQLVLITCVGPLLWKNHLKNNISYESRDKHYH